jgi:hypothetical protein
MAVRSSKQLLAVFASEWHGMLDDARRRREPVVVAVARKWRVPAEQIVYDIAGIGRSFGSYLSQESETRQLLEPREALTARLHRSPDLFDALLMTFTYLEEG